MEFRRKNDSWDITGETPVTYEDNIIQWYDAISDKIQKNRELKSIAQVAYKNQNILVIVPLQEDAASLLARLTFADRYLPVIERMTENRKRMVDDSSIAERIVGRRKGNTLYFFRKALFIGQFV